jgi:hypothetical protein
MKRIDKICPICSKAFSVPLCHQDRYKTCGYKCGGIYRLKPPIINKCFNCSKEFISKKYKRIKAKFCSKICSSMNQKTGKTFICTFCKKEFYLPHNLVKRRNYVRKYCSQKCFAKDYQAKSLEREMPGSYQRNAWKVYEKKCYDCGIKDKRILVIHHIDGNRKNGKIDNLIPVCHNCHCIRHIELSRNHRMPSYRGD